jgi:hypothetical protein
MAVELGLHALKDLGVKANVDRFRYLEEECAVLLERERALADAWSNWRGQSSSIRTRLTALQAHSRVHPYLEGLLTSPNRLTASKSLPLEELPSMMS